MTHRVGTYTVYHWVPPINLLVAVALFGHVYVHVTAKLNLLYGVFHWLGNILNLIQMPLYDLHKLTRPTEGRLAISICFQYLAAPMAISYKCRCVFGPHRTKWSRLLFSNLMTNKQAICNSTWGLPQKSGPQFR